MHPAPRQNDELVKNIEELRPTFIERAASNDAKHELPLENLNDLNKLGLLNLLISEAAGGWGADVIRGTNVLPFVLAMEELARADMSTAHCFQVHNHAANFLEYVCEADQVSRYFEASLERGAPLSWVASEPGRMADPLKFDTSAVKVDGGFCVNGLKNYATNAQAADWILVHVARSDLRDQGLSDTESSQLMMIRREAEGVEVDASWWTPSGMRACVSPKVKLTNVFVPDEDLVGEPGLYVKSHLGSRFHLGFAANYLGASQAMLDFVTDYLPGRGTGNSPLTQRSVGEITRCIWSTRSLVHSAAEMWPRDTVQNAEMASLTAKYQAITCAEEVASEAIGLAGSTAMFDGTLIERTVRDLRVHQLHAHKETTAQMIGMGMLGKLFDPATQQYLVESLQGPPRTTT